MATSFSILRGHHVYKSLWTPVMNEELNVQIEDSNTFDEFAVAMVETSLAMFHGSLQEPAGTF